MASVSSSTGRAKRYLPLLEALERLCRNPGGERLVTLLAQYAPSWVVQLPGLLSASALADLQHTLAGTTRARMQRELSVALEAASATQPLVLVLEDLHWSDPSTVEALAMLARRREPARLLVVGTYRAAEVVMREHPLQPMKHELLRQGRAVEVALSHLSPAAVETYVATRVAEPDAAAALAPVVYRRTNGHPLFMVHVTDYLVQERGRIPATPMALGALERALPPSLRELIAAQLERLSAEEQQVLKVASVAGVEFAVASVAVGLQGADDTIEAVCERLARRGLFLEERELATWPDGTVSGRYAFRHGLYQDVLYQGLTPGLRARLHQQIGERQERAYGEQAREVAPELAMHFERGQDYSRAVRHLRQAAEHATRRHAPHEIIGLVTKALELLATLAETPARAQQELDLLLVLGPAVQGTKGSAAPEVEQIYARTQLLCAQLGETPHLFSALRGLWRIAFNKASYRTALGLGKQLEELAHRTADPTHLSDAQGVLALTLLNMGEYTTAQSHCDQGLALQDATAQRVERPHAVGAPGVKLFLAMEFLVIDALIKWCLGYPAQALRRSQQALAEARASSPYDLAFVQSYAADLHCRRRDPQAVQAHADALLSLATAQGFPLWMANAAVWRGWALVMQGQHGAGLVGIRRGMQEALATGDAWARPRDLRLLVEALGNAGEAETGLGLLTEALEKIETAGQGDSLSETHRLHGVLLLQQDVPDPARVEMCFQQALIIARQQQAKAWELRAAVNLSRLWQQQGKRAEAYELLAPVYGWFTEGFDTADLQEARALLAVPA
jgi:tetratricopeptide (TPR) repeat protein